MHRPEIKDQKSSEFRLEAVSHTDVTVCFFLQRPPQGGTPNVNFIKTEHAACTMHMLVKGW